MLISLVPIFIQTE